MRAVRCADVEKTSSILQAITLSGSKALILDCVKRGEDDEDVSRGELPVRKGRSVIVQRSGSDEKRARNEAEANGYGPPRRPKRAYHGKRDLTPKD